MRQLNQTMLTLIPLLAGFMITAPVADLHARGDRGSHSNVAANEGHHGGEAHGNRDGFNHEGNSHQEYNRGYEHGYEHGYNHGYNHGNNYYGEPAVGVGVGVGIGGVGLGAEVYQEPVPVQPVYYTPEPGVNINIGN